jgi:hypothetical protein
MCGTYDSKPHFRGPKNPGKGIAPPNLDGDNHSGAIFYAGEGRPRRETSSSPDGEREAGNLWPVRRSFERGGSSLPSRARGHGGRTSGARRVELCLLG